jgi:diguanylate cyclase (GGDEF)-like protein
MIRKNMKRSSILFSAVVALILISSLKIYFISLQYNKLKNDGNIINKSGVIRGNIQRVCKLALANELENCDCEINNIDNLIKKFQLEAKGYELKGFSNLYLEEILKIKNIWESLKNKIKVYQLNPGDDKNKKEFLKISEECWKIANEMVNKAQSYSKIKVDFFKIVIMIVAFNIIFVLFIGYLVNKYVRKELEFLANYDSLTKALNRFSFNTIIEKEIENSRRYNHPLSLIILDIDYFKKVNDTYGHKIGDFVLRDLSKIVKETIRKSDYFFRIGGEEFSVVLPNTSKINGSKLAERIRKNIENNEFLKVSKITVSIGITELLKNDTADTFDNRADEALYEAKETGRNKVIQS